MALPSILPSVSRLRIKRAFDFVTAFCALIIASPVILCIAVVQRLTTSGTIFYRQERIGKGGRPFRIIKFRTLRPEWEGSGNRPRLTGGKETDADTPIGGFLRSKHLDELPQLWNVLVGDMSLVGYRPERRFFIDQIMERDPRYALLYAMRPGVTSEASIYNGYTDTMEKMLRRLEMDLDYMPRASLSTDLSIIAQTFCALFRDPEKGRNAHNR